MIERQFPRPSEPSKQSPRAAAMINLKGQYPRKRQPDRQTAGESLGVPLGLRIKIALTVIPRFRDK